MGKNGVLFNEIWQNGVATGKTYEFDIKSSVGEKLTGVRELVGVKQIELAEATGIYQADISKIERGLLILRCLH